MLNTKKIENEMSSKKISKTKLCATTGIARTTLDAILNGSDAKISTIESLSKALNLRIGFLFDEEITEIREAGRDYVEKGKIEHYGAENNGSGTIVVGDAILAEKVKSLETLVAEKDARIEELKERIEELKTRN